MWIGLRLCVFRIQVVRSAPAYPLCSKVSELIADTRMLGSALGFIARCSDSFWRVCCLGVLSCDALLVLFRNPGSGLTLDECSWCVCLDALRGVILGVLCIQRIRLGLARW